jgi:peptide/nickel transport system substrate-binding protein
MSDRGHGASWVLPRLWWPTSPLRPADRARGPAAGHRQRRPPAWSAGGPANARSIRPALAPRAAALAALASALWGVAPPPAAARDIAVGLAAPPTSFDPHYHAHTPSLALQSHVFEGLVRTDPDMRLRPVLAREWAPLPGGDGWEFRLDPAARFHDGAPVTAADVAASIARVAAIPNSPGRYTSNTAQIAAAETAGPHLLRLRTHGPAPLLPALLGGVLVVPERIAREAATADFNAGRAAVGSGPYRLREYVPGDRVVLERHDAWWGGPPEPWTRVAFRVVANGAARVAALRAGDVALIEAVPARDAAALGRDPDFAVARAPSTRLIYLGLDQRSDTAPGLADAQGRALDRNPLKDPRVRRALSLAIDRDALARHVMEGQAMPTGQLLPAGFPSADPELRPDPHDPERARRLLADAGWGGGLRIALAGPNDRYVNDEQILQAVAQMWERIGVRARVEAVPSMVYFSRLAQRNLDGNAYGAALIGWGAAGPEPHTYVAAILAAADRSRGRGVSNYWGYANPRLDALLDQALVTLDTDRRIGLWREAARLAMEDAAILPLHHQVNIWATRAGLAYAPRPDELTLATGLRPAP